MASWRARHMLTCHAELPAQFLLRGTPVVTRIFERKDNGAVLTLVDLSLTSDSPRDAFYSSIELVEILTDACSYLSYGMSAAEIVGVTPHFAEIGEVFLAALPSPTYARDTVQLGKAKVEALTATTDSTIAIALHHFRLAHSAPTSIRGIVESWSGVEAIADRIARRRGRFREKKCAKCGHGHRQGPDTFEQIQQMFAAARPPGLPDYDPIEGTNHARKVRGKIAHAGAVHGLDLHRDARLALTKTQSALAAIMAKETSTKADARKWPVFGTPCIEAKLRMVMNGDNLSIEVPHAEARSEFAFSQLPDEFTDGHSDEFRVFVPAVVSVNQLALPEIRA